MEKKSIRLNRINPGKSIGRPDGKKRAAKYNYADMEDGTIKVAEGFAGRVMELRNARGVSGREMSLSLGQSAGYINNIENGNNLPSLAMFFEICEYLRVTPGEFFSYARANEDFDLRRRQDRRREYLRRQCKSWRAYAILHLPLPQRACRHR